MRPANLAPTRIDGLEACRAAAAILVMLFHLGESYSGEPFFELFKRGYAGVDLFFVISGFIIFRTLQPGSSIKTFAAKRFFRIFPPYWVILSLYVLTFGLAAIFLPGFERDLSPDRLVTSYLLLPSYDHVIAIAWTLSCEILFYLVAGVTYIRFGPAYCVAIVFVWGAGNAILNMIGLDFDLLPLSPIFLEFFFGIVAALLFARTAARNSRLGAAAAIVGALCLFYFLFIAPDSVTQNWHRVIIFGLPSAALVYGISSIPVRLPSIVILLGGASYILYLIHVLVFVVFGRLLLEVGMVDAALSGATLALISISIALVAHSKLEIPYQNWYRSRLRRDGQIVADNLVQ